MLFRSVPAGHSNAGQAISYDRANTMAHNAIADAVTFGLLKLSTLGITSGTSSLPLVVDTQATAAVLGGTTALPSTFGIYASGTESAVPAAVLQLFTQGRDDVVTLPQTDEDSPPVYRQIDGALGFDGRFSCLYMLSPTIASSMSAGQPARLSAVVFHNRASGNANVSDLVVTGTWQPDFSLGFTPPADRSLSECFRAGTVFYTSGRLYQARSVTFDNAGGAHVMLSGTTKIGRAHV